MSERKNIVSFRACPKTLEIINEMQVKDKRTRGLAIEQAITRYYYEIFKKELEKRKE